MALKNQVSASPRTAVGSRETPSIAYHLLRDWTSKQESYYFMANAVMGKSKSRGAWRRGAPWVSSGQGSCSGRTLMKERGGWVRGRVFQATRMAHGGDLNKVQGGGLVNWGRKRQSRHSGLTFMSKSLDLMLRFGTFRKSLCSDLLNDLERGEMGGRGWLGGCCRDDLGVGEGSKGEEGEAERDGRGLLEVDSIGLGDGIG